MVNLSGLLLGNLYIQYTVSLFYILDAEMALRDVCIKTKAFNFYGIFLCVCRTKLV